MIRIFKHIHIWCWSCSSFLRCSWEILFFFLILRTLYSIILYHKMRYLLTLTLFQNHIISKWWMLIFIFQAIVLNSPTTQVWEKLRVQFKRVVYLRRSVTCAHIFILAYSIIVMNPPPGKNITSDWLVIQYTGLILLYSIRLYHT